MAKVKKSGIEKPIPLDDGEDDATLAAIDEGIRDAKAGRTVPAEEVSFGLSRIIGLGKFRSGISDLGSAKKRLGKFGRG